MIIPIDALEADTLYSLAEAFVLREGTDYGEQEVALEVKVQQVLERLKQGDAVLVYSELHESVDIYPRFHEVLNTPKPRHLASISLTLAAPSPLGQPLVRHSRCLRAAQTLLPNCKVYRLLAHLLELSFRLLKVCCVYRVYTMWYLSV